MLYVKSIGLAWICSLWWNVGVQHLSNIMYNWHGLDTGICVRTLHSIVPECMYKVSFTVITVQVTGRAYESMQSQNTRLLQQVTEKDEAINQLRGQVMKVIAQAPDRAFRDVRLQFHEPYTEYSHLRVLCFGWHSYYSGTKLERLVCSDWNVFAGVGYCSAKSSSASFCQNVGILLVESLGFWTSAATEIITFYSLIMQLRLAK